MNGKIKAILLLVVMYGLGVASGVLWQTCRDRDHQRMSIRGQKYTERRITRMKTKLNLTPAQEETIRAIFKKAHERASQMNNKVSWDLADIHRESVQAIRQVLTPKQLERFEKMHQKYHSRHDYLPEDSVPRPPAPKERS